MNKYTIYQKNGESETFTADNQVHAFVKFVNDDYGLIKNKYDSISFISTGAKDYSFDQDKKMWVSGLFKKELMADITKTKKNRK